MLDPLDDIADRMSLIANWKKNGLTEDLVGSVTHNGSHPKYSARIDEYVGQLQKDVERNLLTKGEALVKLSAYQDRVRRKLVSSDVSSSVNGIVF